MGVHIITVEDGEPRKFADIGIYVKEVVILDNIEWEAQAFAMMLGVIYAPNMAYPEELRYFYEFIQKVLLQMDGSPKVLGLKNKMHAGL